VPVEVTSPMYATGVGLVMLGLQRSEKQKPLAGEKPVEEPVHEKSEKTARKAGAGKKLEDWFRKFFEDGIREDKR